MFSLMDTHFAIVEAKKSKPKCYIHFKENNAIEKRVYQKRKKTTKAKNEILIYGCFKKKQDYGTLSHSRLTLLLPSHFGTQKMGNFGSTLSPLPPIKNLDIILYFLVIPKAF